MVSKEMNMPNIQATMADASHCEFCFDALLFEFKRGDLNEPPFPDVNCGVFVTWTKRSETTNSYSLRGCIGTLQPQWIRSSIREYCIKSAFGDQRFQPIWEGEVPFLCCDVSLLFSYESAKDWKDWEIGVHGLIIRFYDERSQVNRSATFLPEIAEDNKWSQKETLYELIRKAGKDSWFVLPRSECCCLGFRDVVSTELLQSVEVTRYQTTVASLTYEQYLRSKQKGELSSNGNGIPSANL